MNIGIIGSGGMGCSLAKKFVALGHAVSIANSRGPASLQLFAAAIGAEASTVEAVTKNKQLIIVSIPQKNIPGLAKDIFTRLAKDVVVIDTCNYYPNLRDGAIPELDQSGIDSLWVQEQLGVPVIKVFNSIIAESIHDLSRPKGDKNRIAMAVAGDDIKAKELVFELVDAMGFDPFDAGPIAQSWKQQPGASVYCRDITLPVLRKRIDAMGSSWSAMRYTVISKRTADEILMKADYPAYLETLQL